ncbi:MAG: UDP-N-acetylmuramoyl-L-alanine--D-glutamate ligase [Anaerolineales bacterium]|nr:UDP-N-acetylmuramoyl-L-alanine--D-glutamate ligase [Anaerolineales bacterium]
MLTNWQGKRVVILGTARQGQALARYLATHGAEVVLNDRRTTEELQAVQKELAHLEIEWVAGGHPVEILDHTDLVCLSGGVPLTLPIVTETIKRGIPLSNDTQIFMEAVPCRTIGITGSAGKTTTTSLVGKMAKNAAAAINKDNSALSKSQHPKAVYVGGNIGDPLINYLDEMTPDDIAILEISSFQLEQMTISPDIAVIMNITPNHLDRHGTMDAYTAAKARILEYQDENGIAILNRDDPGSWSLREKVKGHLVSFGLCQPDRDQDGTFIQDGFIYSQNQSVVVSMATQDVIHLRGFHNQMNVLAACAIGRSAGFPLDTMLTAIDEFRGVPHRLEFVREWNGALWYNDSIATTPERTMAAIRSFSEPMILLLGGRDKDLPWEDLAQLIQEKKVQPVLFGEAAVKIENALKKAGGQSSSLRICSSLKDAVQAAADIARQGTIVLLSPGGTSYDEFFDFEERGKEFKKWVQALS